MGLNPGFTLKLDGNDGPLGDVRNNNEINKIINNKMW